MAVTISVYSFMILVGLVVLFQAALVAGMPWGEITMGGRFPGKLPARMRVAAAFSAVLALVFGLIVAVRAGLLLPQWQPLSFSLVWVVVVYFALGVIVHILTQSRWERIIWLPVVAAMLISSIAIALS
jgi:hypothetical protein